jgi:hypothetical protein
MHNEPETTRLMRMGDPRWVSGARTSLGRGPWQQGGRRRGRHKVQTFIRATCPLKLLRTRGSDRRAELRLTRGSGQPLSTARRPTGKSPARELRIGHSQDLGLPASALTMIIVSESSAKATQPVRTGRYTPARLRSSAAPSNTPRYADVLPISVHTEEVTGSIPVSPTTITAGQTRFLGRTSAVRASAALAQTEQKACG